MEKTRWQINYQMGLIGSQKQSYVAKLNSYKEALNYAKELLSKLKMVDVSLDTSNDNLTSYFSIDNRPAFADEIQKLRSNVQDMINNLNQNIIPKIESHISELSSTISSLQYQINNLNTEYLNAEK